MVHSVAIESDKHAKRVQDGKHRYSGCSDSDLPHESSPNGIFGKDTLLGSGTSGWGHCLRFATREGRWFRWA
jgi:hypothetical protein